MILLNNYNGYCRNYTFCHLLLHDLWGREQRGAVARCCRVGVITAAPQGRHARAHQHPPMLRVWLLSAALVGACGFSHVLRLPVPAFSSCAVARTPAVLMKKGRAQGGGPKISLGRKRKTETEISAAKLRTELARAAKRHKKKPTIMQGRQADRFADQATPDTPGWPVFARGADVEDAEWLAVGEVSVSATSGIDHLDAARIQKRLILEHARRLHPTLQLLDALECGLPVSERDGDPTSLERADAPPAGSALELAAMCGFRATPRPTDGHYWGDSGADGAPQATDASKVKLDRLGNDAKSAVAEKFQKTLGLRSG